MEVFLILLSYSPRNIFASIHTNLGYCFSTFSTVKIWYHMQHTSLAVLCLALSVKQQTIHNYPTRPKRLINVYLLSIYKMGCNKKNKTKVPLSRRMQEGGAKGVGPRCHLPAAFVVLASFPSPSPCSHSRSRSRSHPLVPTAVIPSSISSSPSSCRLVI